MYVCLCVCVHMYFFYVRIMCQCLYTHIFNLIDPAYEHVNYLDRGPVSNNHIKRKYNQERQ